MKALRGSAKRKSAEQEVTRRQPHPYTPAVGVQRHGDECFRCGCSPLTALPEVPVFTSVLQPVSGRGDTSELVRVSVQVSPPAVFPAARRLERTLIQINKPEFREPNLLWPGVCGRREAGWGGMGGGALVAFWKDKCQTSLRTDAPSIDTFSGIETTTITSTMAEAREPELSSILGDALKDSVDSLDSLDSVDSLSTEPGVKAEHLSLVKLSRVIPRQENAAVLGKQTEAASCMQIPFPHPFLAAAPVNSLKLFLQELLTAPAQTTTELPRVPIQTDRTSAQTDSPAIQANILIVQTESPVLQTESPTFQTDSLMVQTESPVAQTESSTMQTGSLSVPIDTTDSIPSQKDTQTPTTVSVPQTEEAAALDEDEEALLVVVLMSSFPCKWQLLTAYMGGWDRVPNPWCQHNPSGMLGFCWHSAQSLSHIQGRGNNGGSQEGMIEAECAGKRGEGELTLPQSALGRRQGPEDGTGRHPKRRRRSAHSITAVILPYLTPRVSATRSDASGRVSRAPLSPAPNRGERVCEWGSGGERERQKRESERYRELGTPVKGVGILWGGLGDLGAGSNGTGKIPDVQTSAIWGQGAGLDQI
ncbi:hypothetical protein JZ751_012344 [Albula glossodonta]|uniref:Uncharacterized protein n=1 Tax=Albula glossodonta TaxID=121402 RepID=A0A8T2PSA0_9TELE|nr:hypothetical protein JZ751_012344 [Albula glossodonta]